MLSYNDGEFTLSNYLLSMLILQLIICIYLLDIQMAKTYLSRIKMYKKTHQSCCYLKDLG